MAKDLDILFERETDCCLAYYRDNFEADKDDEIWFGNLKINSCKTLYSSLVKLNLEYVLVVWVILLPNWQG